MEAGRGVKEDCYRDAKGVAPNEIEIRSHRKQGLR